MELGLSLGDATAAKPFGFLPKNDGPDQNHANSNFCGNNNNNNKTSAGLALGFCMALGTSNSEEKSKENDADVDADADADDDYDDDDDNTSEDTIRDDDQRGDSVDTPLQLDLLPLVPVPRSSNTSLKRPLRWSSDNGSSGENGSSGNVGGLPMATTRGFDVNRLPTTAVGGGTAAEEVCSPNSVASSFQMDICIFRGSGSLGNNNSSTTARHRRDTAVVAVNDAAEAERAASSRASDEDENGLNTRKKLRLSKEQSAYLEESFKEHNTLNPKQKLALAKQLNLRPRQVEVWFQNRRARTKLKQTEVDCEYLKRCCETLTEENRRLHKELQELRALKTSNPFYMQLPATTLTMCPSCERVATTTPTPTSAAPPSSTATIAIPSSTSAADASTKAKASTSTDSVAKAIPLTLSRPRLYPFPHATNHSHQSAAS